MNTLAKKSIGLFLSLLLPVSFVLLWKLEHKMYPQRDEAFYKIVSQEIYITAKTKGFFEALKFAYTHKHWKPVLHPVLGALTLGLADGDIRNSVAIYDLLVYSIFLTLIYFYISRYIGNFRSIFAILFISSIPWIFGISTSFNSEIGFLTSIVAILLYYSHYPEILTKKNAVAYALLFSLASSFRPVETALLFGVFIIGYLAEMKYRNKTGVLPLVISCLWLIFFLVSMGLPYFKLKRDWHPREIYIFLSAALIIFIICLAAVRKHKGNFNHVLSISLFFLIQLLWYLPAAYTFFDWIMFANFGTLAQQTGNRLGKPLTDFIYFYCNRIGWAPFILVGIICMSYTKFTFKLLKNYRFWLFVIGSLCIPFIAGSLSYNGDVRYYYGAWVIGMLLLIKTALDKSNPRQNYATVAISVCSVLLYVGLSPYLLGEARNLVPGFIRERFGFSFYNLHAKNYSAEPLALEEMKTMVKNTEYDYKFFIFYEFFGDVNETPDPFALTLISRENGLNWVSDFLGFLPADDKYEQHLNELKKYDYIILGPLGEHWNLQNSRWHQLIRNLINVCRSNGKLTADLNDLFEFNTAFSLKSKGKNLGEYCAFKNKAKVPHPRTTEFHQL